MSDTRLWAQRASLGRFVITSLAHPRRPGAGGEFSFCECIRVFLFSKPKVLVKDDLKHGSFGGALAPQPTWLDCCLKKKIRQGCCRMNEVPGKSGSESSRGETVNWSPEAKDKPPRIHSWGLVFLKCDCRAGPRKLSRYPKVCWDFIQGSYSPLG